ncbi:MAG TPA: DNA repair protein RecN [Deltaproteobacteria bacterium]|nr:DNA repair protein RecN [Deltaproteobacteria bacterium]
MIEFLKISSLAIFDEIEIEFIQGLNCITGETGAGKSLIMGALTLLMGAKASRDLVRPGREKTSIEALISVSGKEMVLRREIFASGSNRCYIDGRLATVSSLAEVSSKVIHIYGQHEYQDLLNPSQHMAIVEELAGLDREDVNTCYVSFSRAHKKLINLKEKIEQYRLEKEDLIYNINELRSIDICEGLEQRLAEELELARSAAELKRSALLADDILYSGNTSVVDLVAQAHEQLARIKTIDRHHEALCDSLKAIIAQVEDLSMGLRERMSTYDYDPEGIEVLEQRLHTVQDLKAKHGTDEAGLIALRDELMRRLDITRESDDMISDAIHDLELAKESYFRKIQEHLAVRRTFADTLCSRINMDLKELGMPGTRFEVRQTDPGMLEDTVFDSHGNIVPPGTLLKGEFFISTNVGHKLLPLHKVASGGELSRIMLAIKVQQKTSQDDTLLFDEIDSGISGQTAFMIAKRLEEIAASSQAIVVTHLHQVASLAQNHLVITKNVTDEHTVSHVHKVQHKERIMELARMIGGESPSSTVIEHARELVEDHERQAGSC